MLAFAGEERPQLEAVIAECEAALKAPVAPTRGAAWRGLGAGTGAIELAYAAWFLSGHEAWGGDGGERLFAALAANDVPLSRRQRTLRRRRAWRTICIRALASTASGRGRWVTTRRRVRMNQAELRDLAAISVAPARRTTAAPPR